MHLSPHELRTLRLLIALLGVGGVTTVLIAASLLWGPAATLFVLGVLLLVFWHTLVTATAHWTYNR